jgi:hypothetical protein
MPDIRFFSSLAYALKKTLPPKGLSHGHCEQLLAAALGHGTFASAQRVSWDIKFPEASNLADQQELDVVNWPEASQGPAWTRTNPPPFPGPTDIVLDAARLERRVVELKHDVSLSMDVLAALATELPTQFPGVRVHRDVNAFQAHCAERVLAESLDSVFRRQIYLPDHDGDMYETTPYLSPLSELQLFLDTSNSSAVVEFSGQVLLGTDVPVGPHCDFRGRFFIERQAECFYSRSFVCLTSVVRPFAMPNPSPDSLGAQRLEKLRQSLGSQFEAEMRKLMGTCENWGPGRYFNPCSCLYALDYLDIDDLYGGYGD